MNNTVSQKVYEFLKKVVKDDIKNYVISVQAPNKKGEGFLGDMCYVSLQDKNSEKTLNFVVKQAFDDKYLRALFPINDFYLNEIYFYSTVWPTFQQFQNIIPASKTFNKIAKCFETTSEEGLESLIMENLKFDNFELYNKRKAFDEEHIKFVLKEYGKFHALSLAYRAVNPEKYSKLSKGLKVIYCQMIEIKSFKKILHAIQKVCLESLQPGTDDDVIHKYKQYVEHCMDKLTNTNEYEENYSVILHGDCWSNNMMFKYDESRKLIDMKLIDFQLTEDGNPVCDLSYFLYAGASKEILDELDYYLKIYHDSLSETLQQFNLQIETIYPFKVLKNDWKRYCYRGFAMGLLVWKLRCTSDENIRDFNDIKENAEDFFEEFLDGKYNKTFFKKNTRNLILHMYNNDFL